MADGPRTSMHGVPADKWERVFGKSRRVGRQGADTGARSGSPFAHVAVPDSVPEEYTEAVARQGMDGMMGQLVGAGMTPQAAQAAARQSALRKDARNQGKPHAHIKTRNET